MKKHMRFFMGAVLAILLAACGGNGAVVSGQNAMLLAAAAPIASTLPNKPVAEAIAEIAASVTVLVPGETAETDVFTLTLTGINSGGQPNPSTHDTNESKIDVALDFTIEFKGQKTLSGASYGSVAMDYNNGVIIQLREVFIRRFDIYEALAFINFEPFCPVYDMRCVLAVPLEAVEDMDAVTLAGPEGAVRFAYDLR